MLNTERLIKHALDECLPLFLVINKMDRLILELKLPPADAYFKIQHTIDEVNKIISSHPNSSSIAYGDAISTGRTMRLSPELGNVTFASGLHGWSFTLESFADMYNKRYSGQIDHAEFAKRLWGDIYHNESTSTFSRKKPHGSSVRTFVSFVLEPLYKLYSSIIGDLCFRLFCAIKMCYVIFCSGCQAMNLSNCKGA